MTLAPTTRLTHVRPDRRLAFARSRLRTAALSRSGRCFVDGHALVPWCRECIH
jgi:hypothetical protein